jgi:hypothetical protein
MQAPNIDRRQSTQTSKQRKGKHASNMHEEVRNTNCRRHKQTRQPADHTATASPTNTRHATPRSKQSHRSKPNKRDQQTEPRHRTKPTKRDQHARKLTNQTDNSTRQSKQPKKRGGN